MTLIEINGMTTTDANVEALLNVAIAENTQLRTRIDAALNALKTEGATNWERVQAAGLILNG